MALIDKVLLSKAKEAAAQAQVAAEHGIAQVQAKYGDLQTKRHHDALLRDLGAAYYARKRGDGSAEAVKAALAAVDAHLAPHARPAPPPPGGYGLDDI